ncbi:MAG TPA: OsmC family protein [Bacteroidales bacterium]|nr:OsmC family protein [Bacteroidales bacterium]
MKVSAKVRNSENHNIVSVRTNKEEKQIEIPSKSTGFGSAVSGGELLLLSIATCFCNDLYREAKKRNLHISAVDVIVTADFESEGEAGTNFQYSVNVESEESAAEIKNLIVHTDQLAEIHKTLRQGVRIKLNDDI